MNVNIYLGYGKRMCGSQWFRTRKHISNVFQTVTMSSFQTTHIEKWNGFVELLCILLKSTRGVNSHSHFIGPSYYKSQFPFTDRLFSSIIFDSRRSQEGNNERRGPGALSLLTAAVLLNFISDPKDEEGTNKRR